MVGGYTFEPDVMAARIHQFEVLRDRIRDQTHVLRRAQEGIAPPAGDEAAGIQARATALSIEAAARHNEAMDDYLTSYLVLLRTASGAYFARENNTGAVFKE